jgi:predicted unusual protein kinase regulating ubiquinone biosynthesis (AarF/ABC1/UbiB family)
VKKLRYFYSERARQEKGFLRENGGLGRHFSLSAALAYSFPMSGRKKPLKNLRTGSLSRSFSLARLGLEAGAKAAGHAVGGLLRSEAAQEAKRQALLLGQAAKLAQELGELKGSLMKAGQMLSVYGEHFLPPEINQILKSLQSDSPPVEWAATHKVLKKQLGEAKLARLEIDEEPIGAASLGQVHRARVKATGQELALKIQYPGVDRAIDGDIKSLQRLLAMSEWLPKIPATEGIFEEVRQMLKREVNYELELEMLQFFGKELAGDPRYVVPRAFPEFSTARVLAMSYEPGIAIDSHDVGALSLPRRNALGAAALDLYFRELFVWNRVQTDPHFGNFRVRLGQGKEPDQLVLYDFGAVRDLSQAFLKDYRRMLHGTFHSDRALFEAGAYALKVLAPDDPQELKDLFYSLCVAITEPFLEPQPYIWKGTDLPRRVSQITWEIVKSFPLRSPPREVVFLDRKMAGMFTLQAVLNAKFDARALLARYLD